MARTTMMGKQIPLLALALTMAVAAWPSNAALHTGRSLLATSDPTVYPGETISLRDQDVEWQVSATGKAPHGSSATRRSATPPPTSKPRTPATLRTAGTRRTESLTIDAASLPRRGSYSAIRRVNAPTGYGMRTYICQVNANRLGASAFSAAYRGTSTINYLQNVSLFSAGCIATNIRCSLKSRTLTIVLYYKCSGRFLVRP